MDTGKALFLRKAVNIDELVEEVELAKKRNEAGIDFVVTREIKLSDIEYIELCNNFSKDCNWINPEDGGVDEEGRIRCLRVTCNNKSILVNSEGYTYPRYVGLEV